MGKRVLFAATCCVILATAFLAVWPLCHPGVVPQPGNEFPAGDTNMLDRATAPVTAGPVDATADAASGTPSKRVEVPMASDLLTAPWFASGHSVQELLWHVPRRAYVPGPNLVFGTGVSTGPGVSGPFPLNKQVYVNAMQPGPSR
jgi:hypothetical protein